jgi:hypothetical protein
MKTHSIKLFDPTATAHLDMLMWQAYYRHDFKRLTILLVRLMHTQFGFNWPQSVRAAYYSGRAASSFRKNAAIKNYTQPLKDLEAFFAYVEQHSIESFDHRQVAEFELEWWLVHRYPKQHTQSLEEALARAMASLYVLSPDNLKAYATYRASAMHVRDIATWKTRTEPNWTEIEILLKKSYVALKKAIE